MGSKVDISSEEDESRFEQNDDDGPGDVTVEPENTIQIDQSASKLNRK